MILLKGGSSGPYTSVFCIVPARAGSKGLPSKNSLLLNGLPLAEHSLLFAPLLTGFENIIFTTDCKFLYSRSYLYPRITYHLRDPHLSGDDTTLVDVILYLYSTIISSNAGSNPAFVLLQPTSPFRHVREIKSALQFASVEGLDSLVSVSSIPYHPSEYVNIDQQSWSYIVTPPRGTTRRQEYIKPPFFITGSFYLATLHHLRAYASFLSPESSFFKTCEPYLVDIDTRADLEAARALFSLMHRSGYAAPFKCC